MRVDVEFALSAAREADMVVDHFVDERPDQAQQVAEITVDRFRGSPDDVVAEEVVRKIRLVRAHGLEPWLRSIARIR